MPEIDRSTDIDAPALELPPNVLFDVLADSRRRGALRYLLECSGEVSLEALSTGLANGEGGPADQLPEELSTVLHHGHLPKLADAGLVRYDSESWVVEPLAAASELAPLLDELAE